MTLAEYKSWLDGMIAVTGDERLQAARAKLDEVAEPAPVMTWVFPRPSPTVLPSWPYPYPTCGSASLEGVEGAVAYNG